MLNNQDFFDPVAIIVKKETGKAISVEPKRKDPHRKLVQAIHSTGTQSASSSDRPPRDISDDGTNRKAYS